MRISRVSSTVLLLSAAGCATPAPNSAFELPQAAQVNAAPAATVLAKDSWTFESAPGTAITTRHYRICLSGSQPGFVTRLPEFLESSLLNNRTALAMLPAPEGRMETFVLANRSEWVRCVQMIWGAKADPYLTIQRGGVTAGGVSVLYDIGARDTLTLAAHEGWHQYMQTAFAQQLPVWIDEGIATYMEGFRTEPVTGRIVFLPWANLERFDRLREAASAGGLLTLRELIESSPARQLSSSGGDALTWYAQAWAMVHWLHESDQGIRAGGLKALLEDAAGGRMLAHVAEKVGPAAEVRVRRRRPGPDLFHAYFSDNIDAANDSYQAFVKRIVSVGAREKIVAGKSPLEP
ncbi:MAG: DUF1570 domain-containing protein [Planctomycetes bacterium]|nr:DUF1570 domain-containing protein [Planctomycetota bacterium]